MEYNIVDKCNTAVQQIKEINFLRSVFVLTLRPLKQMNRKNQRSRSQAAIEHRQSTLRLSEVTYASQNKPHGTMEEMPIKLNAILAKSCTTQQINVGENFAITVMDVF